MNFSVEIPFKKEYDEPPFALYNENKKKNVSTHHPIQSKELMI